MFGVRAARIAATAVSAVGLALFGAAVPAQAATHYVVFVNYYSDASLTTFVGSWTFNDCPGERGSWGYGAQTPYHIISSEPCSGPGSIPG
jgi:uncharacterized protein DUF6289